MPIPQPLSPSINVASTTSGSGTSNTSPASTTQKSTAEQLPKQDDKLRNTQVEIVIEEFHGNPKDAKEYAKTRAKELANQKGHPVKVKLKVYGDSQGGGGVPAGGSGSGPVGPPGTYRKEYPIDPSKDLTPGVFNTIAGETSVNPKNIAGVDAVINVALNRVGGPGFGSNLNSVFRQPGQFSGYKQASVSQQQLIEQRIRLLSSGSVSDNTYGATQYRAASYLNTPSDVYMPEFGTYGGKGKSFYNDAKAQGWNEIGGNVFAKRDTSGPFASTPGNGGGAGGGGGEGGDNKPREVTSDEQKPEDRPTDVKEKTEEKKDRKQPKTDPRILKTNFTKARVTEGSTGAGDDEADQYESSPAVSASNLQLFQGTPRELLPNIPSMEAILGDLPQSSLPMFTSQLPPMLVSTLPNGAFPGVETAGSINLMNLLMLLGGLNNPIAVQALITIINSLSGGSIFIPPNTTANQLSNILSSYPSGLPQNINQNLAYNAIGIANIPGLLPPNLQRLIPLAPPRITQNNPYIQNDIERNRQFSPRTVPSEQTSNPGSGREKIDSIVSSSGLNYSEKVSKYYTLAQVTYQVAGTGYHLEGYKVPIQEEKKNLSFLALNVLDKLHDQFPGMVIRQCYRGSAEKSSSQTSNHRIGAAADLHWTGGNQTLVTAAKWVSQNIDFNECFIEHANSVWLHVSIKQSGNRHRGGTMDGGTPQSPTISQGNYYIPRGFA